MKKHILALSICILIASAFLSAYQFRTSTNATPVVAMHLLNYNNDEKLMDLENELPAYKAKGINLLFLEVDYHFEFKTHPELRESRFISYAGAKRFSAACKANGIKLVPQFQSLGHQSWAENTGKFLTVYPELDLTPGAFPGNKGIYCREWDVTNSIVNEIIFPMISEILFAFQTDGLHMGMDEIFLLGSKESPNTFGKDPGELFAKTINEFYEYFTVKNHIQLYMWGDRLIDGKKYNYGDWESSTNGTATALTMIPKDIIICDWHYDNRAEYPSIPMFLENGFKVIPCSYVNPQAANSLIKYSFQLDNPGVIGHCFTSWSSVPNDSLLIYPAFVGGMKTLTEKLFWDVSIKEQSLNDGNITVELQTNKKDAIIHYTIDGSIPTLSSPTYKTPLLLSKSSNIKAIAFIDDKPAGELASKYFEIHLATGKKVTITPAPSDKYKTPLGNQTLVNSISGGPGFSDGEWVGINGQDVTIIIDLGKAHPVKSLSFNSYHQPNSWILGTKIYEVQLSTDGTTYHTPLKLKNNQKENSYSYCFHNLSSWNTTNARYIKLTIPKQLLPEGHAGAGSPAWLFVDEVVVK